MGRINADNTEIAEIQRVSARGEQADINLRFAAHLGVNPTDR